MRSPAVPILVVVALGTLAVSLLVLFQALGMRTELDATRAEVAELEAAMAEEAPALTDEELATRLDELEADLRAALTSSGANGSGGNPNGGSDEVLERFDEVLAAIEALDRRVDEICENVPVC